MAHPQSVTEEKLTTLDKVAKHSRVLVSGLLPGNSPLCRKLSALGVVAGTAVTVLRSAPFGDPISIRLLGYTLSLRLSEARHVLVNLAS